MRSSLTFQVCQSLEMMAEMGHEVTLHSLPSLPLESCLASASRTQSWNKPRALTGQLHYSRRTVIDLILGMMFDLGWSCDDEIFWWKVMMTCVNKSEWEAMTPSQTRRGRLKRDLVWVSTHNLTSQSHVISFFKTRGRTYPLVKEER